MADGSFDLAISNVPFGDYKLSRSAVQRPQFSRSRLLLRESNREGAAGRIDRVHHVERNARQGQLQLARITCATRSISSARSGCRTPHSRRTRTPKSPRTSCSFEAGRWRKAERPAVAESRWSTSTPTASRFRSTNTSPRNPHMMLGRRWRMPARCIASNEPALVPDGRDLASALARSCDCAAARHLPQSGAGNTTSCRIGANPRRRTT